MSDNAGAPAIVDLDHDGALDVVATFIYISMNPQRAVCPVRDLGPIGDPALDLPERQVR